MNLTDLTDKVGTVIAIAGAALSAVVHAYQLVVNGGGVRGIWRRFLNGNDKPGGQP